MRLNGFRTAARSAAFAFLMVWLVCAAPVGAGTGQQEVLARVELSGLLEELGLPIYAHLQGRDGSDYALVIATLSELKDSGQPYTVLHRTDPQAGARKYLIALERRAGARSAAARDVTVLFDDGRQIIAWVTPEEAARLVEYGFEIAWLPEEAMTLAEPSYALFELITDYNPKVAEQIGKVTAAEVTALCGNLSGENTVQIGGKDYKIETRNTNNTTWQPLSTQYVYEYLKAQGLETSYHVWSSPKRNVVAEKPGATKPDEIVLVTAHLDDMPSSGKAPGADDNASGSAAVLLAAKIMKNYTFDRTIRFVLFTGEEQGLLGSNQYAKKVAADGDDIVGVLNMDMIAWDKEGGPVVRLHTRTNSNPGNPGDKAIANLFIDVVNLYGLKGLLTPVIDPDGITASDHASFWSKGFAALLAIEDDQDDFNDYYHTANDKLDKLNIAYFTNFVKAALGTAAHLAGSGGSIAPVEIKSVSTGKKYALAEAKLGAKAYIDRSYTVNKLGANLSGGTLVQTANDDKKVTTANHLVLKLNQAATVYVCYDKRVKTLPSWLKTGWTLTTESFGTTDSPASPMKVYKKTVAAGAQLTLGGNLGGGASGAQSNYLVVVK
jgi:hypothetical protein